MLLEGIPKEVTSVSHQDQTDLELTAELDSWLQGWSRDHSSSLASLKNA